MNRKATSLLATVKVGDEIEAFEAAKELYGMDLTQDTGPEVASILIDILQNGLRPYNRAAAAYILQTFRCTEVTTALEDVLENRRESSRVRGHVAETLSYNPGPRSVDILLESIADGDAEVKYNCIYALGRIGDLKATPTLTRIAKQDSEEFYDGHSLRDEALAALASIEESL